MPKSLEDRPTVLPEGGCHPHHPKCLTFANYGPRRGQFAPTTAPVRLQPTYAATAKSKSNGNFIGNANGIGPLIMIGALFAASCNDLVERWASLCVTDGSLWPNICCTSYKVRPALTRKDAYWCRKSWMRR